MNPKFWRQPNLFLLIYLLALYLLAINRNSENGFLYREVIRLSALLVSFGLPHFLGMAVGRNKPRLENVLITTLILLLLSDPRTSLGSMFVLGLATTAIKTFFRFENQPLFNPAAAGLFATSFFGVITTWWGVSFSPRLPFFNISLAMFLTLPAGLYLAWLYRKIPTLLSVPASLALVYFFLKGTLPLTTIFEGTFAFFLLVMAMEPKTTPVIDWQEWFSGLLLGLLLALLFVFRPVREPYLAALLLMNLVSSTLKWLQLRSTLRVSNSKKKSKFDAIH